MAMFKNPLAKEGKGVEKGDREKKSGFALFNDTYFGRFWKICQATIVFWLASIPTFVVVMILSGLVSVPLVEAITPILEGSLKEVENVEPGMLESLIVWGDVIIRVIISTLVAAFWGMGPASAGYTYILRNFARGDHAWIWSDFLEFSKKNFRQSVCMWVIDMAVLFLLVYAYMFYAEAGGALQIVKYVVACVFLAYTMMHIYIYQLLITFKLSIGEIVKNSFLFTILALPENFLVLAVSLFVHLILVYVGLNVPLIGGMLGYWTIYAIFVVFVFPGFSGLLMNFVADRTINKYMIDGEKKETAE